MLRHEQPDDEFMCGLCLAEYNDPRALPCLHVYCRQCLDALMARSQNAQMVSCPVCRKPAHVPNCRSAEGFPSDFRTKRLQEWKKNLTPKCRCSVCLSVQVTHICDTCGPLCRKCALKEMAVKTSHKVRLNAWRMQELNIVTLVVKLRLFKKGKERWIFGIYHVQSRQFQHIVVIRFALSVYADVRDNTY